MNCVRQLGNFCADPRIVGKLAHQNGEAVVVGGNAAQKILQSVYPLFLADFLSFAASTRHLALRLLLEAATRAVAYARSVRSG